MSESKPSRETSAQATTRVDAAHHAASEISRASEPSMELLTAIAGHGSDHSEDPSRGQAVELAQLLQEKQRLLDERESELNARSAMLENQLRHARLSPSHTDGNLEFDDDTQAPPSPMEFGIDLAESLETEDKHEPEDAEVNQDSVEVILDESHFEPVEDDEEDQEILPEETVATGPANEHSEVKDAESEEAEVFFQQQELKRQREELLSRKSDLDERQAHVEQMYDQMTQLHREALELQVSTESIWSELMQEFPSEELSARLAETRSRLADHYRLTNEALADRKDELHAMREELTTQESRLRQQRRELQMWADRRYDEIETRTAQLIRRERELDRLESEFDRQAIQWQQQRESYRQEIERLSWELRGDTTPTT